MTTTKDANGDHVCQHGTAMDFHCCNCHSGFIFDNDHVCSPASMEAAMHEVGVMAMTAQSDPHATADVYRQTLINICNFALEAQEALGAPPHADAPPQMQRLMELAHKEAHRLHWKAHGTWSHNEMLNSQAVDGHTFYPEAHFGDGGFAACLHPDCAMVRVSVPVADASRSTPAPELKVLREAWEHGIKTAIGYGDNTHHLRGAQADAAFRGFLDSLHIRFEGDVPAPPLTKQVVIAIGDQPDGWSTCLTCGHHGPTPWTIMHRSGCPLDCCIRRWPPGGSDAAPAQGGGTGTAD